MRKLPLVLILLLLEVIFAEEFDVLKALKDCESAVGQLNPTCYKSMGGLCRERMDPSAKFQTLMNAQFVGQPQAQKLIKQIIYTRKQEETSVFLIGGPNGLGKTLSFRLLSEALYLHPKESVLILEGPHYLVKSDEEAYQLRKKLEKTVVQQLAKCPNSLIIFDDIHDVNPLTLDILTPILDRTKKIYTSMDGIVIDKSKAIFGFITDFGKMDITSSNTFDEAMDILMKIKNKFWSPEKLGEKVADLIQFHIPFLPLSHKEMKQLYIMKIQKFYKPTSIEVTDFAWNYLFQKVENYENGRGGRAIENIVISMADLQKFETKPLFIDIRSPKDRASKSGFEKLTFSEYEA